jgi:hypothetical protein
VYVCVCVCVCQTEHKVVPRFKNSDIKAGSLLFSDARRGRWFSRCVVNLHYESDHRVCVN